jgi:hypothetical protein
MMNSVRVNDPAILNFVMISLTFLALINYQAIVLRLFSVPSLQEAA